MKYKLRVKQRGGVETVLADRIETVGRGEILVWRSEGEPRLRILDASVSFTIVGIIIDGKENVPSGLEQVSVRIIGVTL